MKRRNFVIGAGAVASGIALSPYIKSKPVFDIVPNEKLLETENDSIMIIVEMFGGNDGLNTLIPIEYEDEYIKLRPALHIPKDFATRIGTSDIYINSALVDDIHNNGFEGLLNSGRLAVVNGLGYDKPNLSHFRSRDIWHTGINSSNPDEKLLEGWVGRYFASKMTDFPNQIPEHPLCVAIGGTVPLMFKSKLGDMGIALTDPDSFFDLGKGLTPKDPRFKAPETNNYQKEYNFADTIAKQSEVYSQAVYSAYQIGKDKLKVNYSEGLAQRFRLISSLIAGGLKTKVYYVNLSNFDSHAQQMQADYKGGHANLLAQVASSISEFVDDAVQQGFSDRVAGLTFSEFGRRAYDNGSRGTDHGAGSLQFVFSASDKNINANYYRMEGHPDLFDLDENGNIKADYDFRRTYADFLQTWFGAEMSEIKSLFGEEFLPFGILKKRGLSVDDFSSTIENNKIEIFPNPSNGLLNFSINFKKNTKLNISIFNTLGAKVLDLGTMNFDIGNYHKSLDLKMLSNGIYYLVLGSGSNLVSNSFIISK